MYGKERIWARNSLVKSKRGENMPEKKLETKEQEPAEPEKPAEPEMPQADPIGSFYHCGVYDEAQKKWVPLTVSLLRKLLSK